MSHSILAVATNMGDPHCGNAATVTAYKTGVPFAVNTIALKAPSVTMYVKINGSGTFTYSIRIPPLFWFPRYVDAAHGGWLGWENNMGDFVSLVDGLNIAAKIRGFSTNVANYQ